MTYSERDLISVWHPFTQMKNATAHINIVKGEAEFIIDDAGNHYIDAVSSWWVNVHGHAHPYLAQKIFEQLNTLEHVIFAGFTHPPAIELAERLLKKLPSNQSKIFFSDNGSTAVEVALKMALQYWYNQGIVKTKVIAFEDGYHGDTFGSMSVGGESAFNAAFRPLLFDVIHISTPVKGKAEASLKQLEQALQNNDVACFIFEPLLLGAGGMLMYDADVLSKMITLCKQHQCIAIADEVMTGFGRTGKFFASEHLSVQPDIMCLSKGLTGGVMPMGITTCAQFVYDAFLSDDKMKTFFHGHSYTGNPTACAAALASLDLFDEEQTWKNINKINELHKEFIAEIKNNAALNDARMIGTVLALEIKTGENTSYFNSISTQLYQFFIQRKMLLRPLGNVIYIMPPYCIKDAELKNIYHAIRELFHKINHKEKLN